MMNLYVLIGLPGSGKSTYSEKIKNENTVVIATDNLREKVFGNRFNKKIKEEVFKMLICESVMHLKNGINVIIDTTFLNEKSYRTIFIKEIDNLEITVRKIAVVVKADIHLCISRDKNRTANRRVGNKVINELNDLISFPENDEKFDLVQIINN